LALLFASAKLEKMKNFSKFAPLHTYFTKDLQAAPRQGGLAATAFRGNISS